MNRLHRARRLAIQGLCCLDVRGAAGLPAVGQFIDDSDEPPETLQAARELLRSAFDDRAQCDQLLARHARHWDLGRLALIDRNILRLAVHELLQGQTPFKVVIAEALKIAQEFSTAESPRFVNGVLDAVAREIHKDISPAPEETRTDEGGQSPTT